MDYDRNVSQRLEELDKRFSSGRRVQAKSCGDGAERRQLCFGHGHSRVVRQLADDDPLNLFQMCVWRYARLVVGVKDEPPY